MSCENIKNGLFSFKIICENNLKRASNCFSDTLEFQISGGNPAVSPLREGAILLSYSPPVCAKVTGVCGDGTNITEPHISGLELSTSNHNGINGNLHSKAFRVLA